MSGKRNYEVGYGKPPRQTRFQKGRSGNPNGRKKGSRNFNADLDEVLEARVPIKENGQYKTVSSQQAALMRLREKALQGDQKALDRLVILAQQRSEEKEAQSAERILTEAEDVILQRFEAGLLARTVTGVQKPDGEEGENDG
ncbi:hypothetical protein FGK63_15625 [Ruegeria sediminis]|uniref:DUF5681 domain-containing protein n=1 Tax=Ruegeria sediminis TaxID=2583820 RepID=A0ABY2WVD4_9RHOB|nr:DUF5681 domain-containing protein [Ruegeria sediminis]TMV06567.1 hypothetical protein FGK63_15625 [Ruegeria sediminis]